MALPILTASGNATLLFTNKQTVCTLFAARLSEIVDLEQQLTFQELLHKLLVGLFTSRHTRTHSYTDTTNTLQRKMKYREEFTINICCERDLHQQAPSTLIIVIIHLIVARKL